MVEIVVIVQGIIFFAVLVFLYWKEKEDRKRNETTEQSVISSLKDSMDKSISHLALSQEKLYGEITKFQDKHFKFSEKQMTKQLDLLHKETKEFMGTIREQLRKEDKITEFINNPMKPIVPIEADKVENTIEKTEEPEYSLSDINRIPMTPGINVQFEGEEEILPVNIE